MSPDNKLCQSAIHRKFGRKTHFYSFFQLSLTIDLTTHAMKNYVSVNGGENDSV